MFRRLLPAALLTSAALCVVVAVAGPLAPPAGPPAPTHKTLADVEPRTPIASLPLTISQPGSYYLTRDLSVAAGNAILVTAPDVTIDLNGFTIRNTGLADRGVFANADALRLRVRNGSIRDFRFQGILAQARSASIDRVRVTVVDVNGGGIELRGDHGVILACTATGSAPTPLGVGLEARGEASSIRSSSAVGFSINVTGGKGSLIARCRTSGGVTGILASTGSRIVDSASFRNAGSGFSIGPSGAVDGCIARQNTTGFSALNTSSTFDNCTARGNTANGFYISAAGVSACVSYDNADNGLESFSGSTISRCVVSANGSYGIRLAGFSTATFNLCDGNVGDGIALLGAGNRVHDNTLTDNRYGLDASASNNLFSRNVASGNTTGQFFVGQPQTNGPVVTAAGSITTPSPFANFQY